MSSERNLSDVNDASRNGQPVIEKANETVKVEQDRHVSSLDIAKELNLTSNLQKVQHHSNKTGSKKKVVQFMTSLGCIMCLTGLQWKGGL